VKSGGGGVYLCGWVELWCMDSVWGGIKVLGGSNG